MDDLVTKLTALVTEAQDALAAAQAAQPAPSTDPNDLLVTDLVAVFTNAGYTVTPPAAENESDAGEAATDTPTEQ